MFADGDVEDCAVLRREAGGRWYDYHCEPSNPMEYHYPYICEFRKIFFFVLLVITLINFENVNNEEQPECNPCNFNYSLTHILLDSVDVADIRQTFYIII